MGKVAATVTKRLITNVPKFKRVLTRARERDVNESDTVTIVIDMLEEIFGFDKYADITREFQIQGTYCDLAVQTSKGIEYLIEVKAIGITLNDKHLRQAVSYAAHQGIKWVVLTNGQKWHIHRVHLEGKIHSQLLFVFDFTTINARKKEQQELLFLLCKRGVKKDLIDNYYEYRQSVNRYTVGALLLTEPVATVVRRELRKLKTGLKVDTTEIRELLETEIIKREVLESESGLEATRQLNRLTRKKQRRKKTISSQPEVTSTSSEEN